jgi:FlaA1/EpsC-like NDP-sugar epimerase/dTDP-4-amino-4,6-dideoxygalactose transaminase/lipopolysaccharide/colanic/teichoic acid biosynthesis glycosyltransferase
MRKDFLSFSTPNIGEEEIAEVVETLRSDWITTGPRTQRFEEEFAAAVGAPRCLALNSCTAALHLALVSLGIGPGDAVLTTPITFCSGVHVIEQVGACPVLVDVEPDTLNIDPVKLSEAIEDFRRRRDSSDRLKAILPVHLYGHPCEMDSLLKIARLHDLAVIEDAAHAQPARYKGRLIGSQETPRGVPWLTCFSFYATKNMTTGEGGMLAGPANIIDEARTWSLHGMNRDAWNRYGLGGSWYYEVIHAGFKYNMTDVQAAIGLCQMAKLSQFHDRRKEIARRYSEAFSQFECLQTPVQRAHVDHAWHLYVLRLNLDRLSISRNLFIQQLAARKIATSVHFIPIHLHRYYREKYGYRPEDFPVAYREYQRMISLPLHPGMSDRDVEDVIEAVCGIVGQHALRPNWPGRTAGITPMLSDHPKAAPAATGILRRAFDRVCAATGLAFLAPLFAMIALAIRLDDGGPVFYSQLRVGQGLRKFRLFKFRSMVPNSAGGSPLTAPEDARVTRMGRFLRKYKLDELPQLVNVLRGEMQLVGVRPQIEKYVAIYPDEYGELLQVPPGITDLASLSFRHEEKLFNEGTIEEQYLGKILPIKLALSLKYHRARTFLSDLEILFRTVLGFRAPSSGVTATTSDPALQLQSNGISRNSTEGFQNSLRGIFNASGWLGDVFCASVRGALSRVRNAALTRAILKYRVWFIAVFQAGLIFFGLLTAWLLRFNFSLPDLRLLLSVAPVLVAIRLAAIARCGLMHGWWRYTGIDDAVAVVKATLIGSIVFVFCVRVVIGNAAFPRTVYILEPLVSILLLAGVRVLSRVVAEALQQETFPAKDVILIGAGTAAQVTLREIGLCGSGYQAIGCVDDDVSKLGIRILGVPVLGTVDDLPALVQKHGVKDILIAVPSATPHQMQRFTEMCRKAQTRFKTVPSWRGIVNGCLDLSSSQENYLENLLGRDPVEIDLESVRKQIEGQTVLVTGGAGTIGSELCRQVLQFDPAKLVCLDRNETGVFYLQMELHAQQKGAQLVFCVTDFGDGERMRNILAEHKPGVIFHAAAYKHVPMMESNVYDALKNNIFALQELLEIAEENGCPSLVLISSDKAVNPINIMGATKRVGELMISCRPAGSMRCVSVRFGNVLGSNGSVVPVLQKQLRDHQQLTITHPEVTRFFMTTHEAASLVLQAFAIGNHGDTLLLEMGRPVRILDIAKTLIRLSGRSKPEADIRFTGLRDGEKLFEELFYPSEVIHPTSSPKIGRIRGTPHGWVDLNRHLHQLRQSMSAKSDAAVRNKVKEIVPEYSPKDGNGTGGVPVNPEPTAASLEILRATMALR